MATATAQWPRAPSPSQLPPRPSPRRPETGTYTSAKSVSITDSTAGAAIYYTTDGTVPTTASNLYSGPITVASTETLKAIAAANGYSNSAVATGAFTIAAATPAFSPKAGDRDLYLGEVGEHHRQHGWSRDLLHH